LQNLRKFVEEKKIIFIDEAQKIENIWNTLKILVDKYKTEKQVIITGSSSINLLDKTTETLTWRKIVYLLYSISVLEIKETYDLKEVYNSINNLLIFWNYPAILNQKDVNKKITLLRELANSSLYRDILEFQQIKNSQVISKLLKLLALQIWKEVSINELATNLWIDTKTVDRYIDLLEKSFIIFKLPPYSTNKRKELSKKNKIYFYDLWIRNSILWDYNELENRQDIWYLWENFLIIERLKKNAYFQNYVNSYFWRNYNQAEIDYIEEKSNMLNAFEIKWWDKNSTIPTSFAQEYKNTDYKTINKNNFLEFII
jgi:predicted AAA+ superfamily ATPase